MAKHKKHIPQKPDDQYPKPDIPADDAWANMLSMLNLEMPVNAESGNPLKKPVNGTSYLIIKSIVVIFTMTGIALFAWWNSKTEPRSISNKFKNTPVTQADSTAATGTAENAVLKSAEANEDSDGTTNKTAYLAPGFQPPLNAKTTETALKNGLRSNIKTRESNLTSSSEIKNIKSQLGKNYSTKTAPASALHFEQPVAVKEYSRRSKDRFEKTGKQMVLQASPSKPEVGKIYDSNGENRLLYSLSTIPTPSLYSPNKPNRPMGISVKTSYASLIINDTISFKRNHSFWNSVHFGLTWNAPIPFSNGSSIILQANGKEQVWPLLIPGIWISKQFDSKNAILLWGKAYNQHYVNQLIQRTDFKTADSAGRYYEKSLLVVQAFQVGIQYNRIVFQKWQLGLGIAYNHSGKALLRGKETLYPGNIVLSDTNYTIKRKAMDWPLIKTAYISGRIEAAYSFRKIKTGVAVTIPITSLADSVTTKPINGQIFLRWQIR